MKKLFSLLAVIALIAISSQNSFAQLTGTITVPSGPYPTFASVVTALNDVGTGGVGAGGLTVNITAPYTEQIPAGGFVINITINLPTSANPLLIQSSGAGVVSFTNPLAGIGTLAGSAGGTGDAFIKLNGTDFTTFIGITLLDNNTTLSNINKIEWGFQLNRATTTDGCKNITIRNCTIVYNQAITTSCFNAFVYTSNYNSANVLTSTASIAGRHENIFIDGNSIYGAITGMYFNGTIDAAAPYNLYDNNIQVGVTTGNTIVCGSRGTINTLTQYGIYSIYNDSMKLNNNTIRINTGTNAATHYGIFTSTGINSNIDIVSNNVSDTANASTSQQIGIANTHGTTGTNNTVNINSNTVSDCRYNTATSPTITYIQNSAGAYTININSNILNNNAIGAGATTATGLVTGILNSVGNTTVGAQLTVSNNTINGMTRVQSIAGGGQMMGIQFGAASYTTTVNNNSVQNLNNAGSTTGTLAGIYNGITVTNGTYVFSNNVINNLTRSAGQTSGLTYGLYTSNSTLNVSSFGNTISNIISTSATSTGAFYGYYNFGSANGQENFYNNTVFNISQSATATGVTIGAYVATGAAAPFPTKQIYGNTIYNVTGGTGQTGGLHTNYAATANVYKNRIYNITSTGITLAPQTYALLCQNSNPASIYNVYNNFVSEIKAPNGSPAALPYGSVMGIWVNGGAQANIFYNTIYLDATSAGANFGSMGLFCSVTPTQNMQNNIIINKSTPNGAGLTIAFVRNGVSPGTYSASSDRNNFYAGAPGANRLIYYDYTNSVQTLAAYKTLIGAPKDANSVTENTAFVNTAASPYDLHLALCATTQLESQGVIVSAPFAITDDFDGNARYNNGGYPQCSTYAATAPDIGADEFGGIQNDLSAPVITYTPMGNISSITNRLFDNVTITDPSGINTAAGTKPRCYYKRTTESNAYAGNTFSDDGWKWVEASGSTTPFDFTIDYSLLFGGLGVTIGDQIQYFVVAQDVALTPNVGLNSGTPFGTITSVADYANLFPLGGTINQYQISATFSGSYNVGANISDNFPSLTGAGGLFAALNAGVMTGNITAFVTTNITEDGTNDLNSLSYDVAGANYTLRIVPADASEKLISGNVANSLIRFDGNDYVTIDGNNGLDGAGTKYLRFRNSNGSNPTMSFQNDSRRNTVTNCFIESNNVNIATSPGTVLFAGTSGPNGNDSNTFSNCEIRDNSDASGTPVYAFVSSGTTSTTAAANSDNVFSDNLIYNFYGNGQFCSGFYLLTGTTAWTITANSFYQTVTRTNTLASGYNIIFIANSVGDNWQITNNYFGGTAPNCGGTPWTTSTVTPGCTNFIYAIRFSTAGVTNISTISGNTVANCDITVDTPPTAGSLFFDAFIIQAGAVNITNNTIGSQSANDNIRMTSNNGLNGSAYFGIDMRGAYGSITGNTIGGISSYGTNTGLSIIVGINEGSTATSAINITGNTIGGTVSNSMSENRLTAGSQMTGIRSTHAGVGLIPSFSNNTIRNFTDAGGGTGFIAGISHSGTSIALINNNSITELRSGSSNAPGVFSGLHTMCGVSLTSTGVGASISNNTIANLINTYAGLNNTMIHGMQVTSSAAVVTEAKNRIYGLVNNSTGPAPVITGINQYWGTGCTIANNQITITNGEATDNSNVKGYINNYDNINPMQNPVKQDINNQKNPVNDGPVQKSPVQNGPVNGSKNKGSGSGSSGNDKEKPTDDTPVNGLVTVNEEPVTDEKMTKPQENQTDLLTTGTLIYGVYDDATTVQNYYYNSIYVGGSASAGTSNSYCYRKTAATHNFMNNILFNARVNTGGATGKHYAIYSTSVTAGSLNSNYNLYVSSNAATIGLWNVTDQTIAQWRTSLGRDKQTWSTVSTSFNASNLFSSIASGNLNINTANAEAWILSGKGIAVSTQNSDYSGDSRVTAIASGTTDIGSDEFGALGMNTPTATVDNPPGSGVVSTYTLWGRSIAVITWGVGGSLYPTSLDVYYNSGINPPNTLGGNYSNSHTIVNATGGPLTGATYDITYYFGDNETYTIGTPGASTILAKYNSSWEVYHFATPGSPSVLTYNTGTQTYTVAVANLYDFSTFALTDDGSALPVTLENFDISVAKRDANVSWTTTSELNNKGFGVERRIKTATGYSQWKEIAFVDGNGTTNERHTYSAKDLRLAAGAYQYRLRQVDYNNNIEYYMPSNNEDVIIGKPGSFELSQNYPNPSNPKSKIDFQMPFDGKVSIKVYDILGKEVASLINDFRTADFYTVEFDGTNVASGTYFYRIIAEGDNQKFTKTLKLILVK